MSIEVLDREGEMPLTLPLEGDLRQCCFRMTARKWTVLFPLD